MTKTLTIAVLAGLLVLFIGGAAAQPGTGGKVLATGEFIQADSTDKLHRAKGRLTAYADRIEIDEAFEVPLGPKYHVYLMRDAEIRSNDDISIGRLIDLGRLRHFKGAQTYTIPRGIDLANWGSIIIYCEGFEMLISPASLRFNQGAAR